MSKGWIGVDLDGSLAHYEPEYMRRGIIGGPIPKMIGRIRKWQDQGITVKLFTARASVPEQLPIVSTWLKKHGLHLEITNVKDLSMIELWDDKAVQLIHNTGERADGVED